VPAAALTELKGEADGDGAAGASTFEALVCFVGMTLLRFGRFGRRILVTKDYRTALDAQVPGRGLGQLFANVVTHGLSFELPAVADLETMPLAEACKSMRACIDAVSLDYVQWQRKTDHHRGLPNLFGGLCCNSWGRALADLSFVETYAIGPRSVDERAANMSFPLDTAYMQVLPQPSGSHSVLLTMPITDLTNALKALPESHFVLPHVSEMRVHAFRVPMPGSLVNKLNPTVETHHIFVKIGCIGDSMTACGYPKYLQALFDRAGIKAQVRSFGVAGTTAQKFADQPYWDERKFEDARIWRPHFIISTLGSNDAKSGNWDSEAFEKDYKDLCMEFLERNSPKPIVYLVTPPPLYEEDAYEMQQEIVNGELPSSIPRVAENAKARHNDPLIAIAKKHRQEVPAEALARTFSIDAFTALGGTALGRRGYFADDGVHLNERGTRLLALTVFAEIRRQCTLELRKMADAACKEEKDPMDML
jgi:lysophospholipase L1-like esterase